MFPSVSARVLKCELPRVEAESLSLRTVSRMKLWWLCACAFILLVCVPFHVTADNIPRRRSNDYFSDPCKAAGYLDDIALTESEYEHFERRWMAYKNNDSDLLISSTSGKASITEETNKDRRRPHVQKLLEEKKELTQLIREARAKLKSPCSDSTDRDCHQEKLTLHKLVAEARAKRKKLKQRLRRLQKESVQEHENESGRHSPVSTPLIRGRRAATSNRAKLWEYGVIPFKIEANYSGENKDLFKLAMRHWENHTCIVFKEKTPEDVNYILFKPMSCGCCSFVGKRGNGEQVISLGKGCYYFGTVVHELGHVIGFWHEHNRPDRDKYVKIVRKNIMPGKDNEFNMKSEDEIDSLGEEYDYDSIMHYSRDKFAKQTYLDTIQPYQRPGTIAVPRIGQNIRLSQGDIRQTNKLYHCPTCGRTVMESSGNIGERPKAGSEQACQWRIVAAHGEHITLKMTRLDLGNCDKDYVEVRDGHYAESPSLGKFCGGELPPLLTSSGTRMWVEYRAGPGSSLGFQAEFEAVCGGTLTGHSGFLNSPGYPDEYGPDKTCEWVITVREGYYVAFHFDTFETEFDTDCGYDYLSFHDGPTSSAPLIGTYCGFREPKDIKSTSNSLYVKFVSDESMQKAGFSATYMEEVDECEGEDHGCEHVCVNTLGSYECTCKIGFELHSDGKKCEKACGGYSDAERGTITSPSFPDLYPSNKNCIWQISAPKGYKLLVNITHLDLEWKEDECSFDYVRVIDVVGTRDVAQGQYCGFQPPNTITSRTNKLKIEFQSDNSVEQTGFSLEYVADVDECDNRNGGCQQLCQNTVGSFQCSCREGFILAADDKTCMEGGCSYDVTEETGVITSPDYPRFYPTRRECEWHFSTAPGHRIQLTFTDFQVEPHRSCRYDNVEAFDGDNTNAPSLGKFCGSEKPAPITSTGNTLTFTFFSDTSVQRKGFRVEHQTVCQGRLPATSTPQKIVSHVEYGDKLYSNRENCSWTLEAPRGGHVRLTFVAFEIEDQAKCTFDYVAVYDGKTENAPLLGKFCGSQIPSPLVSSKRHLFVRFFSDDTIKARGFSATYALADD